MSSMSSKKNADQVDIGMVIDDIWDRIAAKEIVYKPINCINEHKCHKHHIESK